VPFGLDELTGLVGAGSSFLGGRSAANAQKEASRRQAQLIKKQSNLFGQTSPLYLQLLQQAAQGLGGYGGPGSAAQMLGYGQPQGQAGHQIAYQNPVTGHYSDPQQQPQMPNYGGLSPEDNLRLKGAEEDINRYAQQNANRLRFNANLSGLNTGAQGAGLARNEQEAMRQYAQFRRGLAVNAPHEQQQRFQNFASLLNPGLGMGAAASAGYGNQAALAGQQADAGYAGVGQALQNYQYQRNLKKYGQNPYGIPTSPRASGARREF